MKPWTSAMSLLVAGAMLAGPAIAQTTPPSGDMKAKDSTGMKSRHGGRAAGVGAEQVKAAQQALKDKGHDPGAVDGKMGPKTQAAVRNFQSKEGLKATGRLDSETRAKLGVEVKGG